MSGTCLSATVWRRQTGCIPLNISVNRTERLSPRIQKQISLFDGQVKGIGMEIKAPVNQDEKLKGKFEYPGSIPGASLPILP
jgi:hypothetical protein